MTADDRRLCCRIVLACAALLLALLLARTASAADPMGPFGAGNGADLAVAKRAPATVDAGRALTYTLVLTDTGALTAADVILTDTLPSGVTWAGTDAPSGWACADPDASQRVVCTAAELASGAAVTFTVRVAVPANTASGTVLANAAAVSSATLDPDGANNAASAATTVTTKADLVVTKSAPATAQVGSMIEYQLTVSNNGPSNAAGAVLDDAWSDLPGVEWWGFALWSPWSWGGGGLHFTANDLPVGVWDFTIWLNLEDTVPDGSSVTNTATIAALTLDPNPGNNTAGPVTTSVQNPSDVAIVKTASPGVRAGSNVTYTLAVRNPGTVTLHDVRVTDTVPARTTFVAADGGGAACELPPVGGTGTLTCTLGTLDAGAERSVTLTVRMPGEAGTDVANTAYVTTSNWQADTGNDASTVTTFAMADLAVAKSAPATVDAGRALTYTLVLTDAGPWPAANVILTDTLPSGVTWAGTDAPSGWACAAPDGSRRVVCTAAELASGAAVTFTVRVTVPSNTVSGTVLANAAAVSSATPDPDGANNTAATWTTVAAKADLLVTKTGPATAQVGSVMYYEMTVTNNGPSDAAGVVLEDALPQGTSLTSWGSDPDWSSWAIVAPGMCYTRSSPLPAGTTTGRVGIWATVQAAALHYSILPNFGTVSASTTDPHPENNTAMVTTALQNDSDVAVTKTASPAGNPLPGATVTYTLWIQNLGATTSAYNVRVLDTLPSGVTFASADGGGATCDLPPVGGAGTLNCTLGTLAGGEQRTITLTVRMPATEGTVVKNNADASTYNWQANTSNDRGTVMLTTTAVADLSVTKTGPAAVDAGAALSYTIEAANAGPWTAANVALVDALPPGTTYAGTDAPPGWSCGDPDPDGRVTCTGALPVSTAPVTFTLHATAAADAAAGSVLKNDVTVSFPAVDPDAGNNAASASTTVARRADLSVQNAAPAGVNAGDTIDYVVTVANAGPSFADAAVTETLPAAAGFRTLAAPPGWTCTTPDVDASGAVRCAAPGLPPGASAAFTVAVRVDPAAADGSVLHAAAAVGCPYDPNAGNDAAAAETQVMNDVDVTIAKAADPASDPSAGSDVIYTLAIANAGTTRAHDVRVTDTVPSGATFVSADGGGAACTQPPAGGTGTLDCALGTLDPGGSAQITLKVSMPVTGETTVANTAYVSTSNPQSEAGNDSDTVTLVTRALADLSVVKAAPAIVARGGAFTYAITVTNAGPSSAADLRLADVLPGGTAWTSTTAPPGWTCVDPDFDVDRTVVCTRATLAEGAASTLYVEVVAPTDAPDPMFLTNDVAVSSATDDPDTTNNSMRTETIASNGANLVLTKRAAAVSPTPVTYTLTVRNAGPFAAGAVELTDAFPAGFVLVAVAPPAGWTCITSTSGVSITGGGLICTALGLGAGAAAVIPITLTASPRLSATVTNRAWVASQTFDGQPADNTAAAVTRVRAADRRVMLPMVVKGK